MKEKRSLKSRIIKYQVITMKIDRKKVDELKELAREIAFNEHRDVSYVDLIRKAIDDTYFRGENAKTKPE